MNRYMIIESGKMDVDRKKDPLSFTLLFFLGIATSIDAFGVGFSFSLLDVSIVLPAITIAYVTFALSFLGVYIGDVIGHLFERKIETSGGIILILMGLRILVQDILEIKVWRNPDVDTEIEVDPEGNISLPLLGKVKATGNTPRQLEEELTRLWGRDYLKNPYVRVYLRKKQFFGLGDLVF